MKIAVRDLKNSDDLDYLGDGELTWFLKKGNFLTKSFYSVEGKCNTTAGHGDLTRLI